ncbi:unnamed protein product (macronuclear) [Paramecium tetraurelia]|uniref:Uncharacterized protein n=1 Tax=Paramecium tetraurelia TaxID=5888 RepID=A0D8S5_PARTE|nr:uncharacterized protein GSPATT00014388001 [Paramecium tetraurelia]CAK79442.1 unnamed protein product [Paramecium tetraurelia]|eukprot:XP_001446839.1 hypothetical protein (macronuclear) [Paramecium tetraurelia strain d4-2]
MGLACSSGSHKSNKSQLQEIKFPLLIAENFIKIIGQLQLSDEVIGDLRYNLNQLIIMRSKLAHCIARLQKRYSDYLLSDLENELQTLLNTVETVLQDSQLKIQFPAIEQYLLEQLELHRYHMKQQI